MEIKTVLKDKESQSAHLQKNVKTHKNTILELENVLQDLQANETRLEDKKRQIQSMEKEIELNTTEHGYSVSYMSNSVDDDLQIKHINELDSIKNEYNRLLNRVKGEHEKTKQRLRESEDNKIECLKQFTVAIDQMRAGIKKHHHCGVSS